jgi:hypothetical protein
MKHTLKKVAALVLAVLMCVSVMVPSLSAATCPGKGQTHSTTNCTYTVTETAATCKTSGSRVATCNVCADTVFVQTIDATGAHDWEMPAATCVAGATKVCKVCKTSEAVTKTNHTWSAWTLTAVSACTVGENVRRTCTGCGAADSVPGDVNGDEKINSLDGLLLMRYLNGWNVNIASPEAMDVNGDGKVNSLDGLILMRYLNGWNVTLG